MKTPDFDFMGKRKIAAVVSTVLILVGIASLVVQGINAGLDFGRVSCPVGWCAASDI